MKQKTISGLKSIEHLKGILIKEKAKKVFIVTGKGSFESSGAAVLITKLLKSYLVSKFNGFSSNPEHKDIEKGLTLVKNLNPDAIIAIGGGSAIDTAKAIKYYYFNSSKKNIPLIAVPTTAGTGSEATHFVAYYQDKKKKSLEGFDVTLPNYVILDPQFLMSLPKEIAASSGADALGQAVESYWSINSTGESKEYAAEAINILLANLEESIESNSKDAKGRVQIAANLAGKAINITKTTACHSISYPLTEHFDISHGHAVVLTLGSLLTYNAEVTKNDCLDRRGRDYVSKTIWEIVDLLGAEDPLDAKFKIKIIMENIGLKMNLSKLGLKKDDLDIVIKEGFNPDRVKNNPRNLTELALKKILKDIY